MVSSASKQLKARYFFALFFIMMALILLLSRVGRSWQLDDKNASASNPLSELEEILNDAETSLVTALEALRLESTESWNKQPSTSASELWSALFASKPLHDELPLDGSQEFIGRNHHLYSLRYEWSEPKLEMTEDSTLLIVGYKIIAEDFDGVDSQKFREGRLMISIETPSVIPAESLRSETSSRQLD